MIFSLYVRLMVPYGGTRDVVGSHFLSFILMRSSIIINCVAVDTLLGLQTVTKSCHSTGVILCPVLRLCASSILPFESFESFSLFAKFVLLMSFFEDVIPTQFLEISYF